MFFQLFRVVVVVGPEAVSDFSDLCGSDDKKRCVGLIGMCVFPVEITGWL